MIRVRVTDAWGRTVELKTDAGYNPDAAEDLTNRVLRLLESMPTEVGEAEWEADEDDETDPSGQPVVPEFTEPYPGTPAPEDED